MMDLMYIGIAVAFFLVTWGLTKICENLKEREPGGKS